jgi:hypothetical protein
MFHVKRFEFTRKIPDGKRKMLAERVRRVAGKNPKENVLPVIEEPRSKLQGPRYG